MLQCDPVPERDQFRGYVSTLSQIYLTTFIREIMTRDGCESHTRFCWDWRKDFFLRARRARARVVASARRNGLAVVLCEVESGIISETSFERSAGRSASLLGRV